MSTLTGTNTGSMFLELGKVCTFKKLHTEEMTAFATAERLVFNMAILNRISLPY